MVCAHCFTILQEYYCKMCELLCGSKILPKSGLEVHFSIPVSIFPSIASPPYPDVEEDGEDDEDPDADCDPDHLNIVVVVVIMIMTIAIILIMISIILMRITAWRMFVVSSERSIFTMSVPTWVKFNSHTYLGEIDFYY